ncbi:protein adenylyltransferase SelO [Acetoanaerobium noterae]|uniref:protein adenylyltransferase SelO n=1 Tax=Acetoanaerobium noterae TaxID=745369 RepID=UPI003221EB53
MNEKYNWNFKTSYELLPEVFYKKVYPNTVKSPELVIFNEELANELGLDSAMLKSEYGENILVGNLGPKDEGLLSLAYAGHQFGHFTMLGDGRALLIGERKNSNGELIDIQLKGSGRTPYSRGGDGRAALGPMLREHLISEAMNALKIPTTRSLAVLKTGEKVYRENSLEGAILVRTALSYIRVGTFEYAAAMGKVEYLKQLADFAIDRHFSKVKKEEKPYLGFLREVICSQAELIARWQAVGFIHGVMNTDNTAISGETIDYGPCAFMDIYDPKTVFSSIDTFGRYSYENQPKILRWNLARLAETLIPLINDNQEKAVSQANELLTEYDEIYLGIYYSLMRDKLGIINASNENNKLVDDLLELLEKNKMDYTNTFVDITFNNLNENEVYESEEFRKWEIRWKDILDNQDGNIELAKLKMKQSNPGIIPRNNLVERALSDVVNNNDYTFYKQLLKNLLSPYEHELIDKEFKKAPIMPQKPYKTYCGT